MNTQTLSLLEQFLAIAKEKHQECPCNTTERRIVDIEAAIAAERSKDQAEPSNPPAAENEASSYDLSIHANPDAGAWAKFFCSLNKASDEAAMVGWFANAMMAMHDHLKGKEQAKRCATYKDKAELVKEAKLGVGK